MNRLVIIGNGFDLAHGLPTGYCDFINDYWQSIPLSFDMYQNTQQYNDELLEVNYEFNRDYHSVFYNIRLEIGEVKNYKDFQDFIKKYSKRSNPIVYEDMNGCRFKFKNNFFKKISELHSIQNWVDVENEYFKLLKECLKENDNSKVKELNKQFNQIKGLLEKYLIKKVENEFVIKPSQIYYQLFFPEMDPAFKIDNYGHEFLERDFEMVENEHKAVVENSEIAITHVLNFNYTSVMQKTVEAFKEPYSYSLQLNNIHGSLNDSSNPINFGFGDEMDKHYGDIEDKNDNTYLENIKSFAYLNTPNYKRLLDFLDHKIYQVCIMGHSCGLSDRTLLHHVFEHKNCKSIKVYYHERDNGTDNYTELAQNISRHFEDKGLMRQRVVNKKLCKPLIKNPYQRVAKTKNDPQS